MRAAITPAPRSPGGHRRCPDGPGRRESWHYEVPMSHASIDWSGIFHIMATPFTDDGALDVDGLPRLVEAVLATGVTGITVLGIAGEAHRLTDEERRRVVEDVVKAVGGYVPVVV